MPSPDRSSFQEPHRDPEERNNRLEIAIGHEVQAFRNKLDMTVVELAKVAGLSAGMLSKIENGLTSPSLATLQRLSGKCWDALSKLRNEMSFTNLRLYQKDGLLRGRLRGWKNAGDYGKIVSVK